MRVLNIGYLVDHASPREGERPKPRYGCANPVTGRNCCAGVPPSVPETEVTHATTMLDKLRAALTQQEWRHGLRVTSSFGLTSLQPDEDIGAAIKRADGALYLAKANGRNRVEIA